MPSPAAQPSDLLDRLFRRLVVNLAALDRAAVHRPVAVREIHERLVPYRTHRAALGFDTHEDYELTLLRLLAGEQDFATAFPEDARTALIAEAAAVNPDPALFRRFPEATIVLNPERVAAALQLPTHAPAAAAPPISDGESAARGTDPPPFTAVLEDVEVEEAEEEAEALADDEGDGGAELPFALVEDGDDETRPAAQPRGITPVTAPCPYCGGNLPVGRTVLFCPHCGQNIGVVHCPTCGSELDVGWQFCITCGQKAIGLG